MRKLPYVILMLSVVICGVCRARAEGDKAAFQPVDVAQFFVTPNQSATLVWQEKTKSSTKRNVAYTVCDYRRKMVKSGTAAANDQGLLELSVTLPRGYYEVAFTKTGERFGIVSIPEMDGQPDPFFAIDGALSWLVPNGKVRFGLVRSLSRAGIAMVRERLSWGEIEPEQGKPRWEGDPRRSYDTLRGQFRQFGIPVLEVFHNAPRWSGLVERYPDELAKTARAWARIGQHWQQAWGAIEMWNEPDISFGANLPGDQYVAVVKAVARGLADSKCRTPIVGGVFAHYDRPFLDSTAKNGMLDLVDVVSFHSYGHAEQMQSLVSKFRQWVSDYKQTAKPLWITECGRPWKRGRDRPDMQEDAVSALDIVMKAVEARACGVQRYFAFVYPYYEERTSNFGMMGRQATPLRSMGAYVQMASRLNGLRYLGDLKCDDPSLRRARLFGNANQTVAVLYTGKSDPDKHVRLDVAVQRAESIDGQMLKIAQSHSVPIPDGLTYVWLSGDQVKSCIETGTQAMELTKAATGEKRPSAGPSSIVMRYQWDKQQVDAKTQGYILRGPARPDTVLTTRVFNLADRPQDVRLELTMTEGPNAAIGHSNRTVHLAASSHVDIPWTIDMAELLGATGQTTLVLTAVAGTEDETARLVIDLKGNPSLQKVLSRFKKHYRLEIDQPDKWRPSIVGHGKMTVKRTKDGAWRLDATFGAGDRWVYPSLQVPKDIDLSRWNGIVIRARCGGPANVRMFLWEGDSGAGYLTPSLAIAPDSQWHTTVARFDAFAPSSANAADLNGRLDLDTVRRLSIGMNTKEKTNWLEVSDLYLLNWGKK